VAETYVSQGALHRRLCLGVCRTPGIFFDVFRLRRQRLGWRGGAAASDVARVDDGGCLAVLEHEAYDSQAAWHGCDAVEQFAMVRTQIVCEVSPVSDSLVAGKLSPGHHSTLQSSAHTFRSLVLSTGLIVKALRVGGQSSILPGNRRCNAFHNRHT
jgi:hypothetical protein